MPPPKVSLLLVDDKPANLLALEAVLDDPGYAFVRASSGFEALKLIEQRDFAAVLLDIQMPIMDGYETARRIKALPRGRDLPIIFVTAVHKESEDVRKGYEAGGIDYLAKPLIPELIQAKVRIYTDLYRRTQELGDNLKLLNQIRERLVAEKKLETVLNGIDEGVIISDAEGTITQINTEARKILGGRKAVPADRLEEIAAWWADTGKALGGDDWALVKAVRTGAVSRNDVITIRCLDGSEKCVVNSALPIKDDGGVVIGAVCVIKESPSPDGERRSRKSSPRR